VYHNVRTLFRGVAQLVARLVWDQDAGGSSPLTSTKETDFDTKIGLLFLCRILKGVVTKRSYIVATPSCFNKMQAVDMMILLFTLYIWVLQIADESGMLIFDPYRKCNKH
jgi:hypothetical protein